MKTHTNKRILLLIVGILGFVNLLYPQVSVDSNHKELDVFLSVDAKIFYKKKKIPKELYGIINDQLEGEKFRLSNPKRKFRESDVVINPLLPRRRLVLIVNIENEWLVVYERGGIDHIMKAIYFDSEKKEVVNYSIYYIFRYVEGLRNAIKLNKFKKTFDDW